jgi:hypothetical protein
MTNEEYIKRLNKIKETVGEDSYAQINDTLIELQEDNTNLNNTIDEKEKNYNDLNEKYKKVLETNGNLIQKISNNIANNSNNDYNDDNESKNKKITLEDIFDEKGNFKD